MSDFDKYESRVANTGDKTMTDEIQSSPKDETQEASSLLLTNNGYSGNSYECNGNVKHVGADTYHSVTMVTDAENTATGRTDSTSGETRERETWGSKLDFLLSVTGFAVDLGNVWRFPYICYKNGGGAFLIPYFFMLIFLGLPLFYMELALGQFHRSGAVVIWKQLCPMFTGVGIGIIFVATYVGMYYNTIIAWALYYLIASCRYEVPWASCDNEWNTPHCFSIAKGNRSLINNETIPSALEYFQFSVLESHRSTGIDDIGGIKWSLCLCLIGVMLLVYFALWKGIKSSGKAVWVTATVPYVVLLVLLIRGATLPGAEVGIRYFFTPVWDKLFEVGVWIDAAAQIFFSLGPGFGTLMALSSYNKFNNNCYMDAMVTAIINCFTSLMAGFVVFSVLGYMGHILNKAVEDLAEEGPGLVFYVYPEAISTLTGSVFWAIIFFLLLITLGLDSTFGGLESVITAICDLSPKLERRRELVVAAVVLYCFLGGLATTTYGGQYVITLLDTHAAPVALIFICFVEAIAVNWFYGVQRFSDDIEKMLGFQPGLYWKICWCFICPAFLMLLFVLSIVAYQGLELDGYRFPPWSEMVGWMITISSPLCIPGYMVYLFITTPGNIKERLVKMITPHSRRGEPTSNFYSGLNTTQCVLHVKTTETGQCLTQDTELSNMCDFQNSDHVTYDGTTNNDNEKEKMLFDNDSFNVNNSEDSRNGVFETGTYEHTNSDVKSPE
ncbi:hypothetical protein ACF0H5_017519 [Mactra antiquata]